MNIFILSLNKRHAARYHCDKHIVKMPLETAQLLYTVLQLMGGSIEYAPLTTTGNRGYKPTHTKHPCVLWLKESLSNFRWLCEFGIELCREYTYRYNRVHACQKHIEWLSTQTPPDLPNVGLTPFKLAINRDKYPQLHTYKDAVLAYRAYYISDKAHLLKYTNRELPHWISTTYHGDA